MKYQVAIQFSEISFDSMIEIEDLLIDGIPADEADVDGHDMGKNEGNIFILTDSPEAVLARVRTILEKFDRAIDFRVGCRAINEEMYVPLWPVGLTDFRVS